jgi:hypothetical protein
VAKKANAKYTVLLGRLLPGRIPAMADRQIDEKKLTLRYREISGATEDVRGTRLADAIARLDRKLHRLPSAKPVCQAVHDQVESDDLAKDARDEAAGPPMRRDELAGQPQAVVPTEERSDRYAAERLSSNARLIPTIAFDWTAAPRTAVYITAPSPIETAVRTDHLAAALKGPRAVECQDQATERSTAPVLMKKRIGTQESAFLGKTKQGTTPLVVGIIFIALALALGRLSLAFNFVGAPNLHLSRPPISAIVGAPPGSAPISRAGASSTPGDEAAAAAKVISGVAQGSFPAIPPPLRDGSPPIPTAIPPESETTDPPLPDGKAVAPTVIQSGSEPADPPPPRDEELAAPTAIPSELASPTLPQDAASGILNSTAHRAEQIGHDRSGTAADSGRRSQRNTNVATIMHHTGTSLQAPSAHVRRGSALPEQCQATQDATHCVPLRRVRARGPTAHRAAGMGPGVPPWNSAPGRFP